MQKGKLEFTKCKQISVIFKVTTDWRLGTGTGCTDKHTGTSAAAPLAAGMIALMMQARYNNCSCETKCNYDNVTVTLQCVCQWNNGIMPMLLILVPCLSSHFI